MSKKNIKFVSSIGNRKKVLSDLEKKIENSRLKENKKESLKAFKILKKSLKNDLQEKSDTIKKHLTKEDGGRYIVLCKDTENMDGTLNNANEIFGNVEIMSIPPFTTKTEKEKIINQFNEENNTTKVLLVNKKTLARYNFSKVDGVVLLFSTNDTITRKNTRIDDAIELCKDDAVIIHFVDTLYVVEKYNGIKNQIMENETANVEFVEEKSFEDVDNVRRKTFNMGVKDSAKLQIMKEYKEKTGKDITINTIYKGHRLGVWQNNLRQAYMNGILKMEEELLKEFEDAGILGDRKRNIQTSDQEKFDLLKSYREKYPDNHISFDTVDDNNIPIGKYRGYLQVSVNAKKSDLSEEQIEYLKQNSLLYYGKEELNEFAKKFNISKRTASVITAKYSNIAEFIKLYKEGKADIKTLKLNKRGIILSESKLPQKKKQTYLELMEAVYGKNVLEDTSNFVIEENITKAFNKLTKKEQNILFKRIGINTEKKTEKQLLEELGCHRAYIYQVQRRCLEKLSRNIPVYNINSLNRLKEKFSNELEKISKMSEKQWQVYHMTSDIETLKFSEVLTRNLKENGYNTLNDLGKATEEELSKVKSVGTKKAEMIVDRIEEIKGFKKADKIKNLKKMLNNINGKISAYNNAYGYYMETENIFDQDEIIPASIIEESSLSKKKKEKAKKQDKLEKIDTQIKTQDKKTERLENVLESEGVSIKNKIVEE